MSKQKDHVADIMDKWYKAMEENKISVQPKASTILGTILADYTISTEPLARDIWAEYMTKTGGEFHAWWSTLSPAEKDEWSKKKEEARNLYDNRSNKQLLKG
jgi:hypothetical protein